MQDSIYNMITFLWSKQRQSPSMNEIKKKEKRKLA